MLARIERRYRLPEGYFKAKLPYLGRARTGHVLEDFTPAERRRLAWHLPDDFNARSPAEQDEILDWVNRVIISGSTDYRAFQAAAIKNRYAVRFRAFQGKGFRRSSRPLLMSIRNWCRRWWMRRPSSNAKWRACSSSRPRR